ncbi:MAG: hypothetical protein JJV97_01460 [SAR324 cluster bacterium]|nr:hypothetical protein [SAR324 cluster bacterium]
MSDRLLGIDEAGRGCVLGDLWLAGVVADENQQNILTQIGCDDSKSFGSGWPAFKKRLNLAQKITDLCEVHLEASSPAIIDKYVSCQKLNALEREMALKIIKRTNFNFDKAILDGKNIFASLANIFPHITAESKADQSNVVVAAASIVAKANRDKALLAYFDSLPLDLSKFRSMGWGYINKNTLHFVRQHYLQLGRLPDNLRLSYRWNALADLR